MQTHFSEQASIDAASTQALTNESMQLESSTILPCSCLLDKVEELLRVEQLVTKELLSEKYKPDSTCQDFPSTEDKSHSIKLGELTQKLRDCSETDNCTEVLLESCKRVGHMLSHLPFVHVEDLQPDSTVSLINPRSISQSTSKNGAAQCFLVISESDSTVGDQEDVKLSLKSISDFVSGSTYGSHVRLMSSMDKDEPSPGFGQKSFV